MSQHILRQSTASQEITLGYFVDSADGDTEKTALTIANTDIKIWKEGATTLVSKNSGGATHISNGIYYCVLDATDTNTAGNLAIYCHVATALAVKLVCRVVPANIYDSLILGTDKLQADAVEILGSAVNTAVAQIGANVVNYAANMAPLQPVTAGNKLDVTATGCAGIDWGNIENKTTVNALSSTTIGASPVSGTVVVGTNNDKTGYTCTVSDKTGFELSTAAYNAIQAKILTDATPFPGARIDANISTAGGGGTDLTPVLNRLPAALISGRMDSFAAEIGGGAQAAVQDAILSDGIPFPGAYIDAAISSITAGSVDLNPVLNRLPLALVGGKMDSTISGLNPALLDVAVSTRTKPADTQAAVTLVATTTNLTNAPTAGDFTATMKTSLNAATPAVTVSDKTGFSLSTAGILGIWHQLSSTVVTAGTMGLIIKTNLDATVSSRGTSTYAGADTPGTTTLLTRVPTALVGGKMDSVISGTVTVGTNNDKTGYSLSAAGNNAIRDTILDDATRFSGAKIDVPISSVSGGTGGGGDIVSIGGSTTAATNLKNWFTNVGFNASASTIGTVTDLTEAVGVDLAPVLDRLPATLIGGKMDSVVSGLNPALLDVAVSTRGTSNYAGGAVASVTAPVTVGTVNDKTGYALSAAGNTAVRDTILSDGVRFQGAYIDVPISSSGGSGTVDLSPVLIRLPALLVNGKMDSAPDWSNVQNQSASVNLGNTTMANVGNVGSVSSVALVNNVNSVINPVTTGVNQDKTGYTLAPGEIDNVGDVTPPAELSGVPTSPASMLEMIQFLYEYFRNQRIISKISNTETLYKENGSTALGTSSISDDGNTFTKGKIG